ncbi:dephospho-CoA kinase [Methylopila capsulata]|uniref:Dephospho-CoA kinase n=1 Tax=Methylopila capsulata TaxID=61654 RepID=A0A9W6IST9_9HYPH|nr:dephospho-CoA kinase [Methylopila capsulata]MBM7851869.1 dephospho-CoA kinase [Methylopila capsulata]GLK54934.1 dephospho-CoA kinase [Methylopila capsulata]
MIVIGLTGSIGMGKSTTAKLFAEEGVPVHDADAVVHALYAGRAVPLVEAAFPGVARDGAVDRKELGTRVIGDAAALAKLEAIVHPLVREAEAAFLAARRAEGADVVVLDIPLLFESGRDGAVDLVVVVSAGPGEQRRRVMQRPGMTEETFRAVLARQTPDADKRARADVVIDTAQGIEPARAQVRALLVRLRSRDGGLTDA